MDGLITRKKQDGEISSSQKMVPKHKSFFFTSALYYLNHAGGIARIS